MALTLSAKITATKGGTTVTNVTSSFALGEMTGDEVHQTIYLSTGTDYVTITKASAPDIGLGSIDVSADYWLLLRNVEATAGTWAVSFDAGSNDHINIGVGQVAGPIKVDGGKYVAVKPSASGDRLEIIACEA